MNRRPPTRQRKRAPVGIIIGAVLAAGLIAFMILATINAVRTTERTGKSGQRIVTHLNLWGTPKYIDVYGNSAEFNLDSDGIIHQDKGAPYSLTVTVTPQGTWHGECRHSGGNSFWYWYGERVSSEDFERLSHR